MLKNYKLHAECIQLYLYISKQEKYVIVKKNDNKSSRTRVVPQLIRGSSVSSPPRSSRSPLS